MRTMPRKSIQTRQQCSPSVQGINLGKPVLRSLSPCGGDIPPQKRFFFADEVHMNMNFFGVGTQYPRASLDVLNQ